MHVLTAVILSTCALGGTPSGEVLDFTAKWCQPCQHMGPIVDRLHRQGLRIRKVDIDQNPDLARQYNVSSIPAFVLVVDGKVVQHITGMQTEQTLLGMLARIPKPAPEFDPKKSEVLVVGNGNQPSSLGTAPKWNPSPPHRGILPFLGGKSAGRTDVAKKDARTADARANNDNDDRGISLDAVRAKDPLQASLRIRITDDGGTNVGSGTIIESKVGRTLILTCGHIFRNFQESARIEVDLFTNGKKDTVLGHYVKHDLDVDLGLISISTDAPLAFTPVSAADTIVKKNDGVASIGCGSGNTPTRENHRIVSTNSYEGPSDIIECTGAPLQGRSGGGLFNRAGDVIGVCMAADEQSGRGLYVGLKAIQNFLNADQAPQSEDQQKSLESEFEEEPVQVADVETEDVPKGIAALRAALGKDADGVVCVVKSRRNSLAGQRVVVLSADAPPESAVASTKRSLQSSRIQKTTIEK